MVTFDRSRVEVGEAMPWKKPPLLSVIVLMPGTPLTVKSVNCWVVERLASPCSCTTAPGGAGEGTKLAMLPPGGIENVCATAGRAGSSIIEEEIAARPSADAEADDSKRRRERSILPKCSRRAVSRVSVAPSLC